MEKEIFKLVLYLLFLFSPSVLVYAFDAVEPKAAIFDFDNDERISLQQYHEWHLNSSGRHEFIALNEADASFGERLILPGRSVEDGAKIAIAAAQEGSDHSIEITSIKDAIRIEYLTSLP